MSNNRQNLDRRNAFIQLHIAVILFGFTGILGDLISLSAIALVWWRVLLTGLSFLLILVVLKKISERTDTSVNKYVLVGFIIAGHWICFYGSVKLANASIAMITMATPPFFTALLEPVILGKKLSKIELLVGLLMIPGMYLIVQDISGLKLTGFLVGLLSAFLASLFAIYNKKYLEKTKEIYISMVEMFSAMVFCTPFILFLCLKQNMSFMPVGNDWIFLGILAFFCTTIAFLLSLRALNYMSAFASNLAVNLEPVYGILLAIVILNEHKELNTSFYIGVILIMIVVFSFPMISKKKTIS